MEVKIRKYFSYICVFLFVFLTLGMSVYAEEADEIQEELLEDIEEENIYTDDIGEDSLFSENYAVPLSEVVEYANDVETAVQILRQQMINRNGLVSIYYQGEYTEGMSAELLKRAVAYDDTLPGMAGDYLRFHYHRVVRRTYKGVNEDGEYIRFEYEIYYLSSYAQELAVNEKVCDILEELDVYSADREMKIRNVYAYITSHVRYDSMIYETFNVHSAYGAAVEGKAVCQGYSLLLYRLLQELGIKNRMISGEAGGVSHIWNIVEIDGYWYNMDTTWDWGKDEQFEWFLVGAENFDKSHIRDSEFMTETFYHMYPMALNDYYKEPVEEPEEETDPVEAFVVRLYKEILGRDADTSGLREWSEVLKSGREQGAKVAQGFVDSDELRKRNLSDDAYIRALYRTFFDREADSSGLTAWKKVLDSGLSRMHVFRGFAESDEFTEICDRYGIVRGFADLTAPRDQNEGVTKYIVRNYRLCLGREADEKGLNDWCDAILSGRNTVKEAAYGFVFSQEFLKKNLSDEEYIRVLYRGFMDREADGPGLSAWKKVLNEGKSREHVFDGFADSIEFRDICASYGVQ
ncbi:DUF4214 domain-containing protein [Frisingicoccus sp.]|uniref:DUF4214 domain-containing protein n=2 Tax=Frisingicoccus sp. TaxID=1918627 RepID=UPI00399AE266